MAEMNLKSFNRITVTIEWINGFLGVGKSPGCRLLSDTGSTAVYSFRVIHPLVCI